MATATTQKAPAKETPKRSNTRLVAAKNLAWIPVRFLQAGAILLIILSVVGDFLWLNGADANRWFALDTQWQWSCVISLGWQVVMFGGQWGCKAAGLAQWWWLYGIFLVLSVVPSVLGYWPIAHPALMDMGCTSLVAGTIIWLALTGSDILPEFILVD